MDNVDTLPHFAASTTETELAMSKLAYDNLVAGLNGVQPPNLINQDVYPVNK